jgi:hypothetical protein
MQLESESACEYPFAVLLVGGREDPHAAIRAPQAMTPMIRAGT